MAFLETALLEPLAGTARAEVVAPELLFQQLVAVDYPDTALHLRFGGVSLTSLAHRLEKMAVRRWVPDSYVAWRTSSDENGCSST